MRRMGSNNNNESNKKKLMVFFPGDTMNYKEKMLNDARNKHYADYCYENVLAFFNSNVNVDVIATVLPNEMIHDSYASYSNLISVFGEAANWDGLASSSSSSSSSSTTSEKVCDIIDGIVKEQVYKLSNINGNSSSSSSSSSTSSNIIIINNTSNRNVGDEEDILKVEVILCGFSKGCIVINQILHELHSPNNNNNNNNNSNSSLWNHYIAIPNVNNNNNPDGNTMIDNISGNSKKVNVKITDIVSLDGGNSNYQGSYPFLHIDSIASQLRYFDVRMIIYKTEYMYSKRASKYRIYLRNEYDDWIACLKRHNVTLHIGDESQASNDDDPLRHHFDVLYQSKSLPFNLSIALPQ